LPSITADVRRCLLAARMLDRRFLLTVENDPRDLRRNIDLLFAESIN
jgi:hypothetical protein